MEVPKSIEQRKFEQRVWCVREARDRGRSSWSWNHWRTVENILVRRYKIQQGLKNA